jgi:hypothetical protein
MQIGQNIKLKRWDPQILFRSLKHSVTAILGVGATQLEHNGVPFSNVKTVKKTIGAPGITGCDFNFTSAANVTAQNIDLGSIVPANARVLEVRIRNVATFTGLTSLAITAGNASAGAQFLASVQCYTLNTIVGTLLALLWTVVPTNAASKVWIGATPGANWSLATAGKLEVNVIYIEIV